MRERKLLVMGVCETRTKETDYRIIHAGYRIITSGGDTGIHGVGFMLAPELETCVERVEQNGERIVSISLKMKDAGTQQGRTSAEKDAFYERLQETVDRAIYRDRLIVCGDWNGYIGEDRRGKEDIVGPFSIGTPNTEGERISNLQELTDCPLRTPSSSIEKITSGRGTGGAKRYRITRRSRSLTCF